MQFYFGRVVIDYLQVIKALITTDLRIEYDQLQTFT